MGSQPVERERERGWEPPPNIFQSPPCSSLPPRPTRSSERRPRLFFVWLGRQGDEVSPVLAALSSSVARCPLDVRTGLMDPDNAFVFLTGSAAPGERVFADAEMRRHPRVAVLSPLGGASGDLIVTRFDYYQVGF